jgi:mono/diheme cytochrome c family protein
VSRHGAGIAIVNLYLFYLIGGTPVALGAQGADASKGKTIYTQVCVQCHGLDGRGNGQVKLVPAPADLTSPRVQSKLDAGLFRSIHEGRKNTAMGAWKYALSDEEIHDVIAYVRMLGRSAGVPKP